MKKAAAFFATLLPALALQAAPAPKWNIQTLGNLGAGGTIAMGVNNRGEIVGYGHTAGGEIHAFHWENGTITDIGVWFPRWPGTLYAINDHGVGVGTGNGTEVVLWENGAWRSLNIAEGTPVDINKSGDVAGTRWTGSRTVGYLYSNGVMTQYAPTQTWLNSMVASLNDRGAVAGSWNLDWDVRHAFIGQNGVMTDLGTFGGNKSIAWDINNHGVAVGSATDAAGVSKAFVYDGVMQPVCGLGADSDAQAINDRGAITGFVGLKGFLCDNGVLTILNDIPEVQAAGWRQMFPQDINEKGWIVGWGFKVGGSPNGDAFVLMPR
jgi:probable HAF family extracellular repeat protein